MDDRFRSLSSRTQRIVLHSWAKTFAEIVFPAINEERLAVLYSDRSAHDKPVSDRTFSRLRERLYNYEVEYGIDILKDEMMALSGTYAKYLNLNSTLKRMDSLIIASNSKRMSRLEMVYTVVANAVRLLD